MNVPYATLDPRKAAAVVRIDVLAMLLERFVRRHNPRTSGEPATPLQRSSRQIRDDRVRLEKWGLHPELREKSKNTDLNDLDRDADVMIPSDELERAKEILFGECEIERTGFQAVFHVCGLV